MTYAAQTTVTAERSRMEIETILKRYGADQFMYGWDESRAAVRFRANGRMVAFMLPFPDKTDRAITHVRHASSTFDTQRTALQQEAAWEQAVRQRWRALALVIKAKLEAVEAGITTFEDEFLAHLLLPDGDTVGDWIRPQIEEVYARGLMPQRLLALAAPKEASS